MSATTRASSQAGLATFHRMPGPRRCPAVARLTDEGHTDLYCSREAGHTGLHRQDDHTWWSTRSTCADDRLEVTRTGEVEVETTYEWGVRWGWTDRPVTYSSEMAARGDIDELRTDGQYGRLVRRRVDTYPWETAR